MDDPTLKALAWIRFRYNRVFSPFLEALNQRESIGYKEVLKILDDPLVFQLAFLVNQKVVTLQEEPWYSSRRWKRGYEDHVVLGPRGPELLAFYGITEGEKRV